MLTTDETFFVASAVLFGDSENGKAVGETKSSRTKVFFHDADRICNYQAVVDSAHLTYSLNMGEATAFVLKGRVLEALASHSSKGQNGVRNRRKA
ncbi:carbohydrate esterase family 5 protein [Karstenula rhodostoma CBS 690.94]|uniref:cutinase n=1 Tax=Karstenula rhodostoma CBS 690.94 TaxID=1392251 RepID=A0A9P4PBJ5_9PLEO|nr:carbohydrate esterase family 5 protein [Karstenula rhodostoma CBS 690.94]